MKTLVKVLIVLLAILLFSTIYFYSKNDVSSLDIEKIKKQNDSLIIEISNNNKKIDSFQTVNKILLEKNKNLAKKLGTVNKKAEEYKKEHEKDINYINSLSNNDITKLFTEQFK